MPHFSSEGPQTLFSLPLPFSPLSGGICCFIRAWRSHQSTYFILQMRSEAGQLPGFCRKERPGVTLPCGLLTSVSLFLLFSSPPTLAVYEHRDLGGQRLICEDTRPSTGGEISFTRVPHPSSRQWLMKTVSWQVRMSSLGLVCGPCPVLMTPTLALWIVPMHAFITDILECSFSEHVHVPLCLKAKVHAVSISLQLLAFEHF